MGGHLSSLTALQVRPFQPQAVLVTNLWPQVGILAVAPALRFCLTLCSSSCARPKASHLESPSALLRASGCLGIRPALPCMREVKESGHPTEGTSVGTDHQSTPGSAGSGGVSDGVRTRFLLSSPLCWLPIHVVCSGSSSLEDSQRLLEMSLKASVPRVSA